MLFRILIATIVFVSGDVKLFAAENIIKSPFTSGLALDQNQKLSHLFNTADMAIFDRSADLSKVFDEAYSLISKSLPGSEFRSVIYFKMEEVIRRAGRAPSDDFIFLMLLEDFGRNREMHKLFVDQLFKNHRWDILAALKELDLLNETESQSVAESIQSYMVTWKERKIVDIVDQLIARLTSHNYVPNVDLKISLSQLSESSFLIEALSAFADFPGVRNALISEEFRTLLNVTLREEMSLHSESLGFFSGRLALQKVLINVLIEKFDFPSLASESELLLLAVQLNPILAREVSQSADRLVRRVPLSATMPFFRTPRSRQSAERIYAMAEAVRRRLSVSHPQLSLANTKDDEHLVKVATQLERQLNNRCEDFLAFHSVEERE
jgi:hypothetical protein